MPFDRRNNVKPMNLNSTRAIDAHRRNLDNLVSVGQDLARTAGKTQEMALASVQTIGYRTAMISRLSEIRWQWPIRNSP